MQDVRKLLEPQPGFFYEPRVLWGTALLSQNVANGLAGAVSPKNDSYYNGSRWPIVLTHVITLACHPAGLVQQGASNFSQIPLHLTAMGGLRYSLGDIRGLLMPTASGESCESLTPPVPDPAPKGGIQTIRSVQNLARWDFQHTLRLPPAAYLEMQVAGRVPTSVDTSSVGVKADVNFYANAPAEGAIWPGSAITRTGFDVSQLTVDQANYYYAQLLTPQSGSDGGGGAFPFLPFTGFVGGTETQLYPSSQVFTSRQAVQQKATYNLPTHLSGFSVGFEQFALDNALADGFGTAFGPLSATTYTRMRVRNGGTGSFWWRDGAPLAICTPTMTPGVVHKLDRPMALQPGEGFKLALPPTFTPNSLLFPSLTGDGENTAQVCALHVSFCGFAAVEA